MLDRLGDVLMVTSALPALRQKYPTARLTVVVPSASTELVASRPEIDSVACLDPPWLAPGMGLVKRPRLYRLAKQVRRLRQRSFDLSISFHADPRGHLIQRVVGARRRIGPSYKGGGWLLTDAVDTSPHVHILERVNAVLHAAGWSGTVVPPDLPVPEATQDRAREFLAARGLTTGRGPVALAPGARDPAKRWTPESWARLAEGIISQHNGLPPVLVGGPDDRDMCERIKAASAGFLVDATGWGILETAALLKLCRVVVTVDSLARHLAAAVGTPVIVLQYAGEREQVWAAYGAHHHVIRKSVSCSPCGQIVCPLPTHDCMGRITPEEVLALLNREDPAARSSIAAVAPGESRSGYVS
jgi:ADP-heptose:LPS heptosyltransferase